MKRHAPSAVRRPLLVLAVFLLAGVSVIRSQTPDTTPRSRLKPISAGWRSLIMPGWGQAATKRWVTGAVFVAWEGTCAMMTLKAHHELQYLKTTGASHVGGKQQEKEDWLTLWIFNHVFAGAEAFVAAHLMDFPTDLRLRAVPRGFAISFPLPRL
jgi:hypothetical protein